MNRAVASSENLAALINIMRRFLAADPDFPLSYAVVLLELARNEGMGLSELHRITGMPVSTLSRIVGALGAKRQKKARSLGLIRQERNKKDHRRRALCLTPEGRQLVRDLTRLTGSS